MRNIGSISPPPQRAILSLDTSRTLYRISPYLHGHFVEHVGRCIYGGLWAGDDPEIPNEEGIRSDLLEALAALKIPVLRWPGGCFADHYHWRDGIGPRQKRPVRRNNPWGGLETNAFGTEEFLGLCRRIGAEPYIVVNVGSGTVEEAVEWLEYCNSRPPNAAAELRAENGSPQPHNVRLWGVGNEPWGCGGNMSPEYYADRFARYATFLRTADPGAKLVLCGSHRNVQWDHRVLSHLGRRIELADFFSVHFYSGRNLSDRDGSPAKLLGLWNELAAKERFLGQTLELIESKCGGRGPALILDEWGTWYREARAGNGLAQANTLADALFAASSLHLFHSLGPRLAMANLAQAVNVLQCLVVTEGRRIAKTATYYAFSMLRPHLGGQRIAFEIESPPLDAGGPKIAQLSASISRNESGRIFVSLVNRSPARPLEVEIEEAGGEPVALEEVQVLSSQSLAGENIPGRPHQVAPKPLAEGRLSSPVTLPEAAVLCGWVAE